MYFRQLDGEETFEYKGNIWLYVYDIELDYNTYIHVTCDAPCDENGYCMLCGASSPLTAIYY
jgi:hypothetical protein